MLRSLTPADATESYLSWFSDLSAQKYIEAASTTSRLTDLEDYIREKVARDDVVFLGIFDRDSGAHIGNLKYEPVDEAAGTAVMGVLIGDPSFRGKGVTPEVLEASMQWLKQRRNVRTIILGVSRENEQAIRAYEKVGFSIQPPTAEHAAKNAHRMVLNF